MTNYVVGFAVSPIWNSILLVRKEQPAWQAGKLNGVGGKIEIGETGSEAMVREFREETGLKTSLDDWRQLLLLKSGEHLINFFVTRSIEGKWLHRLDGVENDAGEMLELWNYERAVADLNKIPNLSWLIPLAVYTHDTYNPFFVEEAVSTNN